MGDWSRDSGTTSATFQIGGPQGPPAAPMISVASVALLEAVNPGTPAALSTGQRATVVGIGQYLLDLGSVATVDHYNTLSVAGGVGRWLLQVPATISNPAILVSDWYLDGVNGSDANAGTTSGAPVKTIMGGIVPKWGTASPTLAQLTTIHVLVGQAAGLESAILEPKCIGVGTNAGGLQIVGTPTNLDGSFTAGVTTQIVRTSAGTDLTVALPAGAPQANAAPGVLVQNLTRTGTYAWIVSVPGGTSMTLTRPYSAATGAVADGTWLAGDSLQFLSVPALNMEFVSPVGGDSDTFFDQVGFAASFIKIPDPSGTGGTSTFGMQPRGCPAKMAYVWVDRYFQGSAIGSPAWNILVLGCYLPSGGSLVGIDSAGNGNLSNAQVTAGLLSGSGAFGVDATNALFASDVIMDGPTELRGTSFVLGAHVSGTMTVRDGCTQLKVGFANVCAAWGSGTIDVRDNASVINSTGSTWAAQLKMATLTLHGATTGCATIPTTGTRHSFIPLTSANLDLWGALEGPGNTGARFAGTAVPTVPPSWTQATWFIDPQNSQGTSSDNNSGLTSGTALRTWAGFASKMGTLSPMLRVNVSVTFLSSHTDNTDPVVWTPFYVAGAVPSIQGAAPAVTAAVFTRNAQKSRAAGSNAMLSGSFSAGAPAAGIMLENTTSGKSSRAIVHSSAGGSNWNLTQPLAKLSVPSTTNAPSEVDTWASTDTINVLAPVAVNIAKFGGTLVDANGAGDNFAYLYQLVVFDPSGVGVDPISIVGAVQCQEVVFQRGACFAGASELQGSSVMLSASSFVNCYFLGGIFSTNYVILIGGGTNNFVNLQQNAVIDGDFVAGGFGLTIAGSVSIGLMFLDVTSNVLGGTVAFVSEYYGSHVLYGTTGKNINFKSQSRGVMTSGTWAAGWTQATLVSTGVQLNGASTGQTHTNASPDVVTSNVATTVANADAATGGTMFNLGGASISKAA